MGVCEQEICMGSCEAENEKLFWQTLIEKSSREPTNEDLIFFGDDIYSCFFSVKPLTAELRKFPEQTRICWSLLTRREAEASKGAKSYKIVLMK